MVRFHESVSDFRYPWDQVARALWFRYPNPWSAHVLSEDVLERYVTADGMLFTKRLLQKTNRVPKWASRFVKASRVYLVEESLVDPKSKTATTYTYNVGYQKVMSVHEKVVYHILDESTTTIARSCCISSEVFGAATALERFGLERYKWNIAATEKGLLWTIIKRNQSLDENSSAIQPVLTTPVNPGSLEIRMSDHTTLSEHAGDDDAAEADAEVGPHDAVPHQLFVSRVTEYAAERARELMQRAADMTQRFRDQNARFNVYARERAKEVMSRTADRRTAMCDVAPTAPAEEHLPERAV